MTGATEQDQPEPRPRVTGRFVDLEQDEAALLVAIGRAVMGGATLEMALRLETARLLSVQHRATGDDTTLPRQLARLDKMTAGQLLEKLRALDFPADLTERIGDAVDRRNALVHRSFEDIEFARVAAGQGNAEALAQRFERLAIECGELAVELDTFAISKLLAMGGGSVQALLEMVNAVDPCTIEDPHERRQAEVVQAFTQMVDFSEVLAELGLADDKTGEDADQAPTEQ